MAQETHSMLRPDRMQPPRHDIHCTVAVTNPVYVMDQVIVPPAAVMRSDDVSGVDTLYWMREAELKHGRIAMLAGMCAGLLGYTSCRAHDPCVSKRLYESCGSDFLASTTCGFVAGSFAVLLHITVCTGSGWCWCRVYFEGVLGRSSRVLLVNA